MDVHGNNVLHIGAILKKFSTLEFLTETLDRGVLRKLAATINNDRRTPFQALESQLSPMNFVSIMVYKETVAERDPLRYTCLQMLRPFSIVECDWRANFLSLPACDTGLNLVDITHFRLNIS